MRVCFLLIHILLCFHGIARGKTTASDIVVMQEGDTTAVKGKLLATINFHNKIFASKCTYPEVISALRQEAKEKGGNVIKITEHLYPNALTHCHRATAEVYKVDNPHTYEREIEWSAGRKLRADDFKGTPEDMYDNQTAAYTYSGISMQSNRVTTFRKARFFVQCRFYCYDSWMKPEFKDNASVLKHEQSHFDLNEVYARKLLKALQEANLNSFNLDQASAVADPIMEASKQAQRRYDEETVHGQNREQQQKWNLMIAKELAELADYARD